MSFLYIIIGERNFKGLKRLFIVESMFMCVRSLGFVEMLNLNILIDRFYFRFRFCCIKLIFVKV